MLILWPEIAILRDVLQHVSLDGHSRSYKRPPRISGSALPDLCCWCVLDLFSECLPTKQTPARARFRTAVLSPCVCSCPAMPRSRTDGMRNSFRFIFRRDQAFVEILLPTFDQLEPFLKDRLPSFQRSCILHLTCQKCLSFLSLFESDPVLLPFWKIL